MDLRFVPAGSDCVSSAGDPAQPEPGDVYDICVVAVVSFPGVPSVVTGSQNTVTGVFTLHVGDFREGAMTRAGVSLPPVRWMRPGSVERGRARTAVQ